jgi:pilus assembly protein Flp/PilA
MKSFVRKIVRFLIAEDGPTTVEYAMILMLIFLVCISAITIFGQSTADSLQKSSDSISDMLDARVPVAPAPPSVPLGRG